MKSPGSRPFGVPAEYLPLHKYLDGRYADTVVLTLAEIDDRRVPPASSEEFMSAAEEREDEFARVRKMPFAKKVIYATRAGQTGRTVLLQQPTPLLLLYLCKNPRITLTEVIQIAKMPSIDALVADYVGTLLKANPQWALSEELKLALVSNAKTPVGTALALMTRLSNRSLSGGSESAR